MDGLSSLGQKIANLPTLIADALTSAFNSVKDAVLSLPSLILNGIKEIFIPDTQALENEFLAFIRELKFQFNFDTEFFENILTDGTPVQDVDEEYSIPGLGTLQLKFLDTKYLYQGVEYFRPFIRGFLVLLLGFFNIKMLLGFIRQDAGVVTGKAVDMEMKARKSDK